MNARDLLISCGMFAVMIAPAPALAQEGRPNEFRDHLFTVGGEGPLMVTIAAGSFIMGSPASESDRTDAEGPQRRVTIPAFAAGKYEVTWAEWDQCVAGGGCSPRSADGFGGGARPLTNVSWYEAFAYTKWMSAATGQAYRLLSEAEWEYAARAGSSERWSFGDSDGSLGAYAWFADNADSATHPVGTKLANAFGLHDMHGNVYEWVQDCYAENYSAGQPSNGSAFEGGSCFTRMLRGGSWRAEPRLRRCGSRGYYPQLLRSAYRGALVAAYRDNTVGFRVARTL